MDSVWWTEAGRVVHSSGASTLRHPQHEPEHRQDLKQPVQVHSHHTQKALYLKGSVGRWSQTFVLQLRAAINPLKPVIKRSIQEMVATMSKATWRIKPLYN